MSEAASSSTSVTGTSKTSSVSPAPSAAATSSQAVSNSTTLPASTPVGSIGSFQKLYPSMWNDFMKSLAQSILTDLKQSEDRLEEAMRRLRENE